MFERTIRTIIHLSTSYHLNNPDLCLCLACGLGPHRGSGREGMTDLFVANPEAYSQKEAEMLCPSVASLVSS